MRFTGSASYVATDELALAVNAAITLSRPLLVKGEPGTGKTQLAEEVARALGAPLFEWHVKSTSKSQHGLYEYDAVSRLGIPSSATNASRTSPITSCPACCGGRSRASGAPYS